MDADTILQLIIALLLLCVGGICSWMVARLSKLADEQASMLARMLKAETDIEHLREKAGEHKNHIEELFKMQTAITEIQSDMKHLGKVLPQVMQILGQLATIAQKRAA